MRRSHRAALARATAAALLIFSCSCIDLHSKAGAEEHVPAIGGESLWDKNNIELSKLYDAVVETIGQKFFDEALLKRLDWKARADAIRPFVLSSSTTDDAVRRINALLAELKTSHTALLTPDDYQYYILLDIVGAGTDGTDLMSRRFWGSGPYYPGIGAFTREINGRHFVDGILEGSPAHQAGLKYGDEIISVDDNPYSPIAAFRNKIGKTVELRIRRSLGTEPQRITAEVVPIVPTKAFSAATAGSARVIERDGRRIGYVHIWSSHDSNSLKMALAKLAGARVGKDASKPVDSLIVDMRGRVGGNVAVARQYLELLDGGSSHNSYWGNWGVTSRSVTFGSSPQNLPFRGRSALLIDHHTRSAAEVMAHGYKRSAFGPVIGTNTAGAVSSGATFVMPGDLLLYVAVAGHRFEGQPLEGVGVSPDHQVERPLPYADGVDPVLDTAIDLLAKQEPR